jgi:hypothetical protein
VEKWDREWYMERGTWLWIWLQSQMAQTDLDPDSDRDLDPQFQRVFSFSPWCGPPNLVVPPLCLPSVACSMSKFGEKEGVLRFDTMV